MKTLLWTLILTTTLSIANASTATGYSTNDELTKNSESRFRALAGGICGSFTTAGTRFKDEFNETMKVHMGKFENIPNPTPKQITDYLNKHKDKMTCGTGKNKKNYMMVAFDEMSHISLFSRVFMQDYMAKDHSAKIDVNAVSYSGPKGTPETVLDYMDKVLQDTANNPGFLKEVKSLRRFFVGRLGAKKFNELSTAKQTSYMHLALLEVQQRLAVSRKKLADSGGDSPYWSVRIEEDEERLRYLEALK